MARKIFIGCVIIHPTDQNPYMRKGVHNPYRIGDGRVEVLRSFRDTGKLPDGFSLWDDSERKPIIKPEEIDWTGMRD